MEAFTAGPDFKVQLDFLGRTQYPSQELIITVESAYFVTVLSNKN